MTKAEFDKGFETQLPLSQAADQPNLHDKLGQLRISKLRQHFARIPQVEAVAEAVHTEVTVQIQMKEVTDQGLVQVMIVQELVEVLIVQEQVGVEIVQEQEAVMIDAMVVLQEKESFRV